MVTFYGSTVFIVFSRYIVHDSLCRFFVQIMMLQPYTKLYTTNWIVHALFEVSSLLSKMKTNKHLLLCVLHTRKPTTFPIDASIGQTKYNGKIWLSHRNIVLHNSTKMPDKTWEQFCVRITMKNMLQTTTNCIILSSSIKVNPSTFACLRPNATLYLNYQTCRTIHHIVHWLKLTNTYQTSSSKHNINYGKPKHTEPPLELPAK